MIRLNTIEEINAAPESIRFIHSMQMIGQPVSIRAFDDAMEKHPEYFPEEVEYKRKWDSVPQEVHDQYWKDYWDASNLVMADVPKSKGIIGWIDDAAGYYTWNLKFSKALKKLEPIEKELHNKHYNKYGL